MSRIVRACVSCLLLAGATVDVRGEELGVAVTVREPAGLVRKAEPASGGIPFKKGQVKTVDDLALFDKAGRPVPAQFSKLAPYEDGSVQWALVDFTVDLPAAGAAEFVVKTGQAKGPERPLRVTEAADGSVVETGPARFTVGSTGLIESVEVGGSRVAGPMALEMADAAGTAFRAGQPFKVAWEYKGPVRATLRVDGPYVDENGKAFIHHTTRLTFRAGSGAVRVDHSIRNSNPAEGDDAKLKWATVSLSLALKGADQGRGKDWLALGDGKAGVLAVCRHTGGCFPGGGASARYRLEAGPGKLTVWSVPEGTGGRGVYGYGDGFFALADCAHKDTEVWLDFYTGARTVAENEARKRALVSALHALADGAWISETAALGYGHFGTLADEAATYRKWGWKGVDDEAKLAPARSPHQPDAYVEKVDMHEESEADSAELFLLMYVRTGERGFLDQGEAYARYFKTHAILRTDGFEYDGFRHERSAASARSKRPCKGLQFGWYGPREYGWSDSRLHMCHQWANGAFDYYCLTGDVDALEGGLDWAEYAAATYPDQKPAKAVGLGRAWGRAFLHVLRAWQVTREPKWREVVDTFGQVAVKAPNRDACGLLLTGLGSYTDYFIRDWLEPRPGKEAPLPPRLKAFMEELGLKHAKVRGELVFTDKTGASWSPRTSPQSFEFEACDMAIARYAELTGDEEAKRLVVDLARGARDVYWSKKCEHIIPHPYLDFPTKGKVFDPAEWDDAHANCPKDPGGKHSGYHTRWFTDVFARAYNASGDKEWLDWAKRAWSRGSKRGYWTTAQSAADDEVAAFAGHKAPKGDGIDIRNSARLFYEVPRAK